MAKETFAQRNFKIGDQHVAKGEDLANLPPNQLQDFKLAGLVGAKPAEEAPAPSGGKA